MGGLYMHSYVCVQNIILHIYIHAHHDYTHTQKHGMDTKDNQA